MKKLYYYFGAAFLISACATQPQATDPIPEHQTFTIMSESLGENRTINVWLPSQFNEVDSYYVMYMPDGGLKEDFPHIANTLDSLVRKHKIPNLILVGVENLQRRKDLSGPTQVDKDREIAPVVGGSAAFRNFIKDELFPAISLRYKTTSRKGIIGESLAGLFIIEALMLDGSMFDDYIAIDPSLWWNDQYLLKNADSFLSHLPADRQKRVWIAGSGAADISDAVKNLSEVIKVKNLPQLQWQYSDEKNEKHNTIYRATKEKALIWTLSNR